jgi:hypothetical protein
LAYEQRFIDLRQAAAEWGTSTIEEAFDFTRERVTRVELQERPKKGALQRLSSALIHERLHCVAAAEE